MAQTILKQFITYGKAFDILYPKYRVLEEEMIFWHANDDLTAYKSDIPSALYRCAGYASSYAYESCDNEYIEYGMYIEEDVHAFEPVSLKRFVKVGNLDADRYWQLYQGYQSTFDILVKAASAKMLRYFDKKTGSLETNVVSKFVNDNGTRHWGESPFCEEYLVNASSVLSLMEIVAVERVFLKRSLDECLQELNIQRDES